MGHFPGHLLINGAPRTKVKKRVNGKGVRYLAMIEEEPDKFVVVQTCDSEEYARYTLDVIVKRIADNSYISQDRNRTTLAWFIENVWLPYKLPKLKRRTRREHERLLRVRILPRFGHYRMRDLADNDMPRMFDAWVQSMIEEKLAPTTIRDYKSALSGILAYAVDQKWLSHNLLKNTWMPDLPDRRAMQIIKPEQWDMIYSQLYSYGDEISLFADLKVNTGLRFGEIANLRGELIGETSQGVGYVIVQDVVADVGALYSDDGGRYAIEKTSKGGKDRKVSISDPQTYANLKAHVAKHGLGPKDLIFSNARMRAEREAAKPKIKTVLTAIPDDLGTFVSPKNGRTYRHGTITGYQMRCEDGADGKRCQWCTAAIQEYRNKRRASGKDRKPEKVRTGTHGLYVRGANTTDHVEIDWYRNNIWKPSLEQAGVNPGIRIHDMRHSHLSWMLAAGLPVYEVMERAGHSQITTTMGYAHLLDEVSHEAVDLMAALRAKRKPGLRVVS